MGRNRTLGSPFEIATITSPQTTEAHVDMEVTVNGVAGKVPYYNP